MLALSIGAIVYSIDLLASMSPAALLSAQICAGALLTIGLCEMSGFRDYVYLKATVKEQITKFAGGRNGGR